MATTVVHRTRKEQTRSKAKVANSVHKLLEEDVLIFELGFQHIDVLEEDLATQGLKLKLRMSGVTYWKSEACRAVTAKDGRPRIGLDTTESAVFEGAEALDFELRRPRCWRSSTTMASCRVPVAEVLKCSACDDGAGAGAWNLELLAPGALKKVLGSLVVDIRVKSLKLFAAGGLAALKAAALPQPPSTDRMQSAIELEHNERECEVFPMMCDKTQQRLKEAFAMAMKAAGDDSLGLRRPSVTASTATGGQSSRVTSKGSEWISEAETASWLSGRPKL